MIYTTYLCYVAISMALVLVVAWTFRTSGTSYLNGALHNKPVANALCNVIVTNFLLFNVGFIALMFKVAPEPTTALEALEVLSGKLGWVMIALALFNMWAFRKIVLYRREALAEKK